MEVPVYNTAGEIVKNISIADNVFAVPFNEAVVHQALVRQHANAHQGTSNTKTRSEVAGSTRKLFRQKGTGHARAGSIKAPQRKGGGIVFGPHPRDYNQAMPKKMHRLALKCALSAKAGDGSLLVLDQLQLEEPKTREIVRILSALKVDSTALVVTDKAEPNIVKSARNLPQVKTLPANLLNVVDLLTYNRLVITEAAVRKAEELWGKNSSQKE